MKGKGTFYFLMRLFFCWSDGVYDSALSDLQRMQHYNTLKAEKYQPWAENIWMWEPLELHNLSESVEKQAAPTEPGRFLLFENLSLETLFTM